jgi:hypothetical protein
MKNVLFLGLITFCSYTYALHYNQIVNAIIESDYDLLANNQKEITITYQQKQQLLKINDDIITVRQDWMVKHAGEPQMGVDLLLSGLGAFITIASLITCAGYSSAHTQDVYDTTLHQSISGSIGIVGAFYTIKKYVDAFLKPKRLLDNALLIKSLLYSL